MFSRRDSLPSRFVYGIVQPPLLQFHTHNTECRAQARRSVFIDIKTLLCYIFSGGYTSVWEEKTMLDKIKAVIKVVMRIVSLCAINKA